MKRWDFDSCDCCCCCCWLK